MHKLLGAATLLAMSSVASAQPITAGVNLGLTQAGDNSDQTDPNHVLGLFGRFNFTPRLAGQLELQKIQSDGTHDIRSVSTFLVVDLGSGRLMPMIVAGFGFDSGSNGCPSCTYGGDVSGHHIEGGFALEYRADGGFTIGVQGRLGGRSIDSQDKLVPLADTHVIGYVPNQLQSGDYRSMGLYAAVRF